MRQNPIRRTAAMLSLAEEIQKVSDNADKCVDYPIGDKLSTFMKCDFLANFY